MEGKKIQNTNINIFIDKDYFIYKKLIEYILERLDLKSLFVHNLNKNNDNKIFKNYDFILYFDNNLVNVYNYYVGKEIVKDNDNTLYILNYDYNYHIGTSMRTLFFSTCNICDCYIDEIVCQDKIVLLSIIYRGNKYELATNQKDNKFYEVVLFMICILSDCGISTELILKIISTYIK